MSTAMNPPSAFESLLLHAAGALLAPRGKNARLLILIYHQVFERHDPLIPTEPDAAAFAAQADLLARHFNVLPLTEAVERLRRRSLPPRAVCITFDDGYANNFSVAQPILAKRRLPATIFVAPGFLDGGRMFNDTIIESLRRAPEDFDLQRFGLPRYRLDSIGARVQAYGDLINRLKHRDPVERLRFSEEIGTLVGTALPSDLMMTSAQVAALARSGIEIGAHTMHHPILASIDAETARTEITRSKQRLEELTEKPVRTFAYPNGKPTTDYRPEHVQLAREAGFDLALSTAWGAASHSSDVFQLPRVAPWDRTALRYALRMLTAYRAEAAPTAALA
jgi:peptidoglycan/xylan/chitin deacetylase (PgdA/CDA1 family)